MSKNKGKTAEELLQEALVPVEEQPYKVPENWVWTAIKSIAEVKGGKRLPSGHDFVSDETNHAYLRVIDLKDGTVNDSDLRYISEKTYKLISRYVISSKDVYITIAGTIGRSGIVPEHLDGSNLTENAAKITNINGSYNRYIYLLLNSESVLKQINLSMKATSQPKLALHRIQDLKIPLPPFEEQKRIVKKVESLLLKINQAKELIEEAKETFELRRAAILNKAFRGDLTSKWRIGNIGGVSAEELLIEINEKKKSNKKKETQYNLNFQIDDSDLPKGWAFCRLGDIIESFKYGTSSKSDYANNGTPVLRIPNVEDFTFNLNDMKYSEGVITSESHLVSNGDILIIRSNGSKDLVGKCSVVTEDCDGFAYASYLIRLRPIGVVPEFVLMLLKSQRVRNQLFRKSKSSAGINNINIEELSSIVIPIAPFEEQKEIVKVVRNLFEKEDLVFGSLNVNENLESLISSVLFKAFRGELGTNESTDESAASLLIDSLQE
ncbi:restriction modification system DNA specificity domain-containing protein [Paenibacillus sp. FSL R7-277]|uniref:restriction endonuclease subunit S n=1 Tax=Paenibacillus sp. FSL R7-277 TaxID=1227352 RepID=UPI0003E22D75|nr:restriction endonuclease subunit S [Paenibacillus sp. FSL R7-277]ETT79614.1 restriction modification system DNA specificity domain-containing protein [Paenibacillus sp. FSL R7-277]